MRLKNIFLIFVLFFVIGIYINVVSADCWIAKGHTFNWSVRAVMTISSPTGNGLVSNIESTEFNDYYVICPETEIGLGAFSNKCGGVGYPNIFKVIGIKNKTASITRNAYAEAPHLTTYKEKICYESLFNCGVYQNSCPTDFFGVVSLSALTDAYVGPFSGTGSYPNKICCLKYCNWECILNENRTDSNTCLDSTTLSYDTCQLHRYASSPSIGCTKWMPNIINCAATGQVCSGAPGSAQCVTPSCIPQTETCNSKDDDCDGEIDEEGVCATPSESCPNGIINIIEVNPAEQCDLGSASDAEWTAAHCIKNTCQCESGYGSAPPGVGVDNGCILIPGDHICEDNLDKNTCNNDNSLDDTRETGEDINCPILVDSGCVFDSEDNLCKLGDKNTYFEYPSCGIAPPNPDCRWKIITEGDCSAGAERVRTVYNLDESTPENDKEECLKRILPAEYKVCPQTVLVPFFTWINFLIAIIVIGLVYLFYNNIRLLKYN